MSRVALRGIVVLALLSAPKTAGATEPLTWELFIGRVEAGHPLIEAAKAGLEQLEAKLGQAEWAIFPSFKLEAGGTITPKVTGDALASDTDWGTIGVYGKLSIDMVQPLWTFGKISALRDAAEAGVEIGKAAVEVARWELRVRAAEAFYGRLLAKELAVILDEGKGWIDKAERRMERLRDEDSKDYDQNEHLRLKTRVADFFALQAQNKLLTTKSVEALRLLLREPDGTTVEVAATGLEPVTCDLGEADQYVALARRSDPTTRIARHSAEAQRYLADAKAAEAWPDIVLVANATLNEATVIEDQPSRFAHDPYHTRTAGAALGLRWKLDIPQRVLQTDEARAKARRASAEAEVAGDLAEFKVRGLVQELANKKELLEVMRKSQKAAQGWLTATWDTYETGFTSFRDVMDALVQFYQQKFGYLQLVFEHNLLIWKLGQAVGTDICAARPEPTPKSP